MAKPDFYGCMYHINTNLANEISNVQESQAADLITLHYLLRIGWPAMEATAQKFHHCGIGY